MDATFTRPKLRWPLDIRMLNLGGQDALVVQCPIGISAAPLALMPQFAPVVVQLDGVKTSDEIVSQFASQGLTHDILRQLIERLDDNLFMANARFFAAEKLSKDAFASSPVRSPALVGRAYPASREELSGMVQGYMGHFDPPEETREIGCLIAPHIDYARGGRCYGGIYPRLSESRADTYILIGTAHQYSRRIFHLCAKDLRLVRIPVIRDLSQSSQTYLVLSDHLPINIFTDGSTPLNYNSRSSRRYIRMRR